MTIASSEALFAGLVQDHGPGVYRFLAGTLGDPRAAEDLAQEVFARAHRSLGDLADPACARSWLFAIAANAARNYHAREKSRDWLPLTAAHATASPGGDDSSMLDLAAALSTLDRDDRAVLLLIGYLGFSAQEVAEQTGLSLAATHKRWQRACAKVRARLEGERP